jgi:hypothetical protein
MAASCNLFGTQVLRVLIIAAKQLARTFAQRQVSSARVNVQVLSFLLSTCCFLKNAASLLKAFHWPLPLPTLQRRQALMKLKETQAMRPLVLCVCALESRCTPRGYQRVAGRRRPSSSFIMCCACQYLTQSQAACTPCGHVFCWRCIAGKCCFAIKMRICFHAHLQSS